MYAPSNTSRSPAIVWEETARDRARSETFKRLPWTCVSIGQSMRSRRALVLVDRVAVQDAHVHVRREPKLTEHPEVVRRRQGPARDPGHEVLRPSADPREVVV